MVSDRRLTSVGFRLYSDLGEAKYSVNRNINSCNYNLGYKIKLKGEKLVVKLTHKPSHMHLLSHRSEEFLAEWLQFSPATIVYIDSRIELEKLKMWANQSRKRKKVVFLRLSKKPKFNTNSNTFFNYFNQLKCWIKRCLDIIGALISIIILAPIFLAIALLIKVYFHKPILQTEWCIGRKGKLFCVYNFSDNFTTINLNFLAKLPQLFNVLKGEMSFVGRFPWSLAEASKIDLLEQPLFNILPGIVESIINRK